MNENSLIITPKTKIGELLDTFPQLEDVLLELSPSFVKLKNPILRKTVAKIATLQQAAAIGGLKVDALVNRLRKEVGQDSSVENTEEGGYVPQKTPEWFNESKIVESFDAIPVINSGGHPMADVMTLAQKLQPGEILELKTPFVPAPLIDMLKSKGFESFSVTEGEEVRSYFKKSD
jgi:uncharacterized protein (DUF2249 family)